MSAKACVAPGCRRDAIAKGMCLMHYKRVRAGLPMVRDEPPVGARSGFGQYGVLDDDGDTVLCHECGRRYVHVGAHLRLGHEGMTSAEYKRIHGLTRGTALAASSVTEAQRRKALDRVQAGDASWRRLEAARDPAAASAARLREQLVRRGADYERAAAVNAARGPSTRRAPSVCVICQRTFTVPTSTRPAKTCSSECTQILRGRNASGPRKGEREGAIWLAHLAGVSTRVLATRHGISQTRVQQILARMRTDPAWQGLRPEYVHGSHHAYLLGCRCPTCRKAENARNAASVARRRAAETIPEYVHGTKNGYDGWGCRCDRCVAASRLASQQSYERRKAKVARARA